MKPRPLTRWERDYIKRCDARDAQRYQRRRQAREEALAGSGHDMQRAALMAKAGYGWEDVMEKAGVTKEQARLLVLGE